MDGSSSLLVALNGESFGKEGEHSPDKVSLVPRVMDEYWMGSMNLNTTWAGQSFSVLLSTKVMPIPHGPGLGDERLELAKENLGDRVEKDQKDKVELKPRGCSGKGKCGTGL